MVNESNSHVVGADRLGTARSAVAVLEGPLAPAAEVAGPMVPQPRGPISAWLLSTVAGAGASVRARPHAADFDGWLPVGDIAADEDVQLALHCIYELSYRGFAGVSDEWEWDPDVLALRRALEGRFEADVRASVAASGVADGAASVSDVLERFDGPSLSRHLAEVGSRRQFEEFCIHRSAYQLKEADPHSWGLLRLSGPRKAALVEIQADEYGNGRVGGAHADLFGDLLEALGIDRTYGAHIDRIPAVSLATGNFITLLGSHRRLRSALLGHLAGFEMTSVVPMSRYAAAARRLRLGAPVERFYDVHVEADEHHGQLASESLVGGDPEVDGLSTPEIIFGAAGLVVLEDQFARRMLRAWERSKTSLRNPG